MADITPDHPQSLVSPGDLLLLRVLRVEPDRRRIGLSLRQVSESEWAEWAAQYHQREAEAAEVEQEVGEAAADYGEVPPADDFQEAEEQEFEAPGAVVQPEEGFARAYDRPQRAEAAPSTEAPQEEPEPHGFGATEGAPANEMDAQPDVDSGSDVTHGMPNIAAEDTDTDQPAEAAPLDFSITEATADAPGALGTEAARDAEPSAKTDEDETAPATREQPGALTS